MRRALRCRSASHAVPVRFPLRPTGHTGYTGRTARPGRFNLPGPCTRPHSATDHHRAGGRDGRGRKLAGFNRRFGDQPDRRGRYRSIDRDGDR